MKNWALIVAALYILIFAVLTVPAAMLAFVPTLGPKDAVGAYTGWQYWLCLGTMFLAQFGLLAVPAYLANLRPVTRGPIWRTILGGGLMAGGLVFGASLSVYEFIFGSKAGNNNNNGDWLNGNLWMWTAIGLGVLTWFIWTLVFLRMSRTAEPADLVSRQCRALFRGSILELLIAVPTHIVARYRDYCCAGFLTFIGLTMGVSVMLFAFGPAVLVLFVKRWQRLHPQPKKKF